MFLENDRKPEIKENDIHKKVSVNSIFNKKHAARIVEKNFNYLTFKMLLISLSEAK